MLELKSSHSTAFSPVSSRALFSSFIFWTILPDEAQAQAVQELDRVWHELIHRYKASKKHFAVSAGKLHRAVYTCGE